MRKFLIVLAPLAVVLMAHFANGATEVDPQSGKRVGDMTQQERKAYSTRKADEAVRKRDDRAARLTCALSMGVDENPKWPVVATPSGGYTVTYGKGQRCVLTADMWRVQ